MVNFTTFASPNSNSSKPPMPDQSSTDTADTDIPDLMSTDMQEAIVRVYEGLRGFHPLLSKSRFSRFLKSIQGETKVELDKSHYTCGEFFYVLFHSYSWDAVAPLPAKDTSHSLANYFINSSHNTYLVGNQLVSRSSPDAYRTVLLRGCRCIEIDVWNGDAITVARSRSKSPTTEHTPRISGSSLPYMATTVIDTVEDTYDTAKYYLNGTTLTHSRSPSSNSRIIPEDISPKSSVHFAANTPNPRDSMDRLEVNQGARRRPRQSLPKGEPIVTHGWTLTAPCGFREVCEAIKESAFVSTDLPIIISLEVHADTEQQETMVRIMKEVWQDMLVQEAIEGLDPKFRLPKLEDLRNKILVKVKRAPANIMAPHNTTALPHIFAEDEDASDTEDERPLIGLGLGLGKVASVPGSPHPAGPHVSNPLPGNHHPGSPLISSPHPRDDKNIKVPICDSLSALAVYTRSERFQGFEKPQAKIPSHIFSISEHRILELYGKHPHEVFTHNKNYFMRAFPAGRRIDSSNPDPSHYWHKGVQMVAMNWQYLDEGMMLNEGMFADEQGWVLKPPTYRSSDKTSRTHHEASPGKKLDLNITVFAAQHIPAHTDEDPECLHSASAIRPIIRAELHVDKAVASDKSVQAKEYTYKQKTDVAKTDHPNFGPNGSVMQFVNIPKVVEELSFIRFKVEDDSRKGIVSSAVLAWACIRLDRLRQGYRFVQLLDMRGNPIQGGKLLVKIEKNLR